MTLVLSNHELRLVEAAGRALAAPSPKALDTWWSDTSSLLLALFGADHAMCALPGGAFLAANIDTDVSARLGTIYALPPAELRRLDPLICAIEDDYGQRPCVVFNRIGKLRRAETGRRRSLVLHDVFERSRLRDSVNVDLLTHGGPARLCVSYDRPHGRVDRALAMARLLVPAFEAGARVLACAADPPLRDDHGLTARELEVARLVAARLRNHEIASSLGISAHTVRHHLENVFAKLDVRSRHDIAARLRRRYSVDANQTSAASAEKSVHSKPGPRSTGLMR